MTTKICKKCTQGNYKIKENWTFHRLEPTRIKDKDKKAIMTKEWRETCTKAR